MANAARPGRRRRHARRVRRVAEHVGVLIAAAAVGSIVLGVVGFRAFVPGRPFTEYLYRSLQLFIIYVDPTGAPDPAKVPVALDVARFLAPAAAAAASIRALLALFGQKAARAWVRYAYRDHVVVCGLGPLGARLAVAFQDDGHRVVAIEADGAGLAVHDCRDSGVIVFVGDPSDRLLLAKAGVLSARYLLVATEDDRTSADVALAARDVVGSRRRRPLPCFVHVVHPGLSGLLVEAALAGAADGAMRFDFFNAWEAVPPMVLDESPHAGAGRENDPAPHMLVVGPGRLGPALVAHAARRWAAEPQAGRRLRVTLVGPGAHEAGRDLSLRYPRFDQVCDLRTHEMRTDSSAFEQAGYLDGPAVTSAYVTLDDDAAGLQAALTVSRVVPRVKVVVLTTQHSGLATIVGEIRPGSSPIELFDVLARTCRPEIVLNGTIELLARAIHRDYVRAQLAAGRTARDNPSLQEWDVLPAATQEANRAQAADIGTKLAAVGCRIQPWADWTGDGLAFAPDEIERMAELEHDRWCRARTADGWTYGPARDDRRRVTPYLVAWDQLTDDVKDYDRNAVRALPELLTYAGFEIVRLPAAGLEGTP